MTPLFGRALAVELTGNVLEHRVVMRDGGLEIFTSLDIGRIREEHLQETTGMTDVEVLLNSMIGLAEMALSGAISATMECE